MSALHRLSTGLQVAIITNKCNGESASARPLCSTENNLTAPKDYIVTIINPTVVYLHIKARRLTVHLIFLCSVEILQLSVSSCCGTMESGTVSSASSVLSHTAKLLDRRTDRHMRFLRNFMTLQWLSVRIQTCLSGHILSFSLYPLSVFYSPDILFCCIAGATSEQRGSISVSSSHTKWTFQATLEHIFHKSSH